MKRVYLTAKQVSGCVTHYGVRVFWSGEDGDVVALTSDVRRGLAAIHALGRHELGQPVASAVEIAGYQTKYVRFWVPDDGTDEWTSESCAPTDDGALPIVQAAEVGPYNERTVCRKLDPRTAKLLREAIVLAYVEGTRRPAEQGVPYPKDSEICSLVLAASVGFRDLYPTLSRLNEAKAADAERRRQSIEHTKQLMAQRKEQQS